MRLFRRAMLYLPLLGVLALVLNVPAVAFGDDARTFNAQFRGVEEVPSVSSDGTASLRVRINGSGDSATIEYRLTYSGLRAPVTQSHIHFAERHVAGGIMVFLCTNLANGPAGTPACPTSSGTVERTLRAADVIGPAGQGITTGEMSRVVKAVREGAAYGNVHSTQFPAGEIRGQLISRGNDDRSRNDY
jgi:CHRD domain